ncbi:hypothetical protein FQA39_LY16668 [Lamprigera yunnana]|nr:hypothetical protein FQA39_LY16668 [Lamprigera yunnana]
MEFRAQEVAQLVLGYLKEAKCRNAFYEFLNNSQYLMDHACNYRRRHYIITRVRGLRLIDYLNEYACIYTIVQERLEASDYFKEHRFHDTLVQQLLFLLDKFEAQSRASTPINEENVVRNFFREDIITDSNNVNKDIDAVPEDTLSFEKVRNEVNSSSSILSSSKNKIVTPKADKCTSTNDDEEIPQIPQEKCEIFTTTFLENSELIEKLADNINKEVSSKSIVDLDSTAIESIVQRTEEDPIIVQLISELIEPPQIELNQNIERPILLNKEPIPEKIKEVIPPKKSTILTESNSKRKLRTTKPHLTNQLSNALIEEQNKAAVESICMHAATISLPEQQQISVAKSTSLISTELVLSTNQAGNVNQSTYTAPTSQNTMFTNTGNLLMLQPNATITTPNIRPQKNLAVDASQSCYIIGNQPYVNVNVPQAPVKVTNVLSEQDILTLPTIILYDNTNQQFGNTQTMMVSTNVNSVSNNKLTKAYKNIAPKPTEKCQSLSEYITLYKCNDPITSSLQLSPKLVLQENPKLMQNLDKKIAPVESNTVQLLEVPEQYVDIEENTLGSAIQTLETPLQTNSSTLECEMETPQSKIVEKKERSSRTTPKSSSHIRQLNFSTPDKWALQKVKLKKNNSKNIIHQEDNEEIESMKAVNKAKTGKDLELKSWDANLRKFEVPKNSIKVVEEKHKKRKKVEEVTQISNPKKLKEYQFEKDKIDSIIDKNPTGTSETCLSIIDDDSKCKELQNSEEKVMPKNKKKIKKKETIESLDTSTTSNITGENSFKCETSNNSGDMKEKQLIIRYGPRAKIKRKCNMENAKKASATDEIILTSVPKIKSCEIIEDVKHSLILSPSKLNANKRNLVETESPTTIEQNNSTTGRSMENKINDELSQAVENKMNENKSDSTVKMNSLPLLQTPAKYDLEIPKTPGTNMFPIVDTPFSKAVIDQLSLIDISALPTPKFPITPNFALTPAVAHSPFSNRGTDYSTSSSYYQPSETEQSKSLEQLIQECQRLEKQNSYDHEDVVIENEVLTEKVTPSVQTSPSVMQMKIDECNIKVKQDSKTEDVIKKMIEEKQKSFNQSLQGKKNMQLARTLVDSPTHDTSSDSDSWKYNSSSSEDDSGATDSSSSSIKENKESPYSLRPRKILNSSPKEKGNLTKSKSTEQRKQEVATTSKNDKLKLSHQQEVLKKLETIRQRTIAKVKNAGAAKLPPVLSRSSTKLNRAIPKTPNEKLSKQKSKLNAFIENPAGSKLKPKPKKPKIVNSVKGELKNSQKKSTNVVSKNGGSKKKYSKQPSRSVDKNEKLNVNKENKLITHLSSDDESLQPLEMVETELLETSSNMDDLEEASEWKIESKQEQSDKILDKEAESLVKGLKQWGIHLVPNKKCATEAKENDIQMEEQILLSNIEEKETVVKGVKKSSEISIEHKKKTTELSKQRRNSMVVENYKNDNRTLLVNETTHSKKNKVSSSKEIVCSKNGNICSKNDATLSEENTNSMKKNEIINTSEMQKRHDDKHTKNNNKELTSKKQKTSTSYKNQQQSENKSKENNALKPEKAEKPTDTVKEKPLQNETSEAQTITNIASEENKTPNKQMEFDIKVYEEETEQIVHNYNSMPTRHISDYNFEILTKQFSATVYIEDSNSEVEKFISCTRLNILLDIPSKMEQESKNRQVIPFKKRNKPLNVLYNQLMKENEIQTSSPLEDLYRSETQTGERYCVQKSNETDENFVRRKRRRSRKLSSTETRELGDELKKIETSGEINSEDKSLLNIEIHAKKSDNSINQSHQLNISDDDLMNYAAIGSERIENSDSVSTSLDKRKRKVSDDTLEENKQQKKKKAEELLKNIDVDTFLKQLHGDT